MVVRAIEMLIKNILLMPVYLVATVFFAMLAIVKGKSVIGLLRVLDEELKECHEAELNYVRGISN